MAGKKRQNPINIKKAPGKPWWHGHNRQKCTLKIAHELMEIGNRQTENEKDVERDAWPVFPEEQR